MFGSLQTALRVLSVSDTDAAFNAADSADRHLLDFPFNLHPSSLFEQQLFLTGSSRVRASRKHFHIHDILLQPSCSFL